MKTNGIMTNGIKLKLFLIFIFSWIILFGTEPREYTTISDMRVISRDSLLFEWMSQTAKGRKNTIADMQLVVLNGSYYKSDTMFIVDTCSDRTVGYYNLDKEWQMLFDSDSIIIRHLKIDTAFADTAYIRNIGGQTANIDSFLNFPKAPSTNPTDSLDFVPMGWVQNQISEAANYSSPQDTISGQTCSESIGDFIQYVGSDTWSDASNAAVANSRGLCGFWIGSGKVLTEGYFTTTGLTDSATYYIGASGAITTTPPTAVGSVTRVIGQAVSTTKLRLKVSQMYLIKK